MKKISIYSGHSLDNAYSCILYLKKALESEFKVILWSNSNKITDQFGKNCFLFKNLWYSGIPKLRFFIKLFHVFLLMIRDEYIIINDLDFYIPAYYAKKIKKKLKVIHYNTEIHGKDVKYYSFIEKFYEKHADFPDMIIECLEERAKYRKNKFNISKEIYVINNTCTYSFIKSVLRNENSFDDLEIIGNRKVLVYAGSCEFGIDLDKVIEAIADLDKEIFFLCYCYGKEESVQKLKNKCLTTLKSNSYRIYNSVERNELLNVLYHIGDIGIVYYDPKKSTNYQYASPSKFFEYMAVGLNILSTNNDGINNIINDNKIGKCFLDENHIADSIREILSDNLLSKKETIELFKNKYCYEKDSEKCIRQIKKLVVGNLDS